MTRLTNILLLSAVAGSGAVSLYHHSSAAALSAAETSASLTQAQAPTTIIESDNSPDWKMSTDNPSGGTGNFDWNTVTLPADNTYTVAPAAGSTAPQGYANYGPYGLTNQRFYLQSDVHFFRREVYFSGPVTGTVEAAVDNNMKFWINGVALGESTLLTAQSWSSPFLGADFDAAGNVVGRNGLQGVGNTVTFNTGATPNVFIVGIRNTVNNDFGAAEVKFTFHGQVTPAPPVTTAPPTTPPVTTAAATTAAATTTAPETPTAAPKDNELESPKMEPAPDAPIMHTADWIHAIVLGPDEVPPKLPGQEEKEDDDLYGSGYGSGSGSEGSGSEASGSQ